ncbi:MAG: DUF935 domain-containing protein [Candidatus Contendobacter sp.]|jgi:phage gp29-like protein|nr:DUF935 domain-containing protein [Candidatus Contendobacter sp.]
MTLLSRALNAVLKKPAKTELTRELIGPALGGISRRFHIPIDQGLTLTQLTAVLRDADYGFADAYLTLAEEMEERDPHYASVISTRKRSVLGLERNVESPTDKLRDRKITDAVRELIAAPDFGQLLPALLDALGKGYSAVELLWQTDRARWTPRYLWRDPRFFRYDRDTGQTLLLAPTYADEGQPLPPYRFIVHQPRLKLGLPIRGGLARLCAATHLCARIALEDWLLFAEVFGMPLRVGRYSSSASAEDIELLKTAVAGLGHDAAAVLHESMKIEFQAAATGAGGAELYERLLDNLNKLISKAVLGRSDAADATSGKLGGETAQSEVRRDILESDAEELADTINRQLVQPFIDLNFGPQPAYPAFRFHFPETEDLNLLTLALEKLVPLGLKVEQSIIRDKFNLPDPEEGAELLGAPAPATPADLSPAVNRALNRAAGNPDPDPTAPLLERLGAEADPLLDALLSPVRALLEDAADLDEFRENLLTLYPDLDGAAFAALMGQALAVADAAGRWEDRE